MDYLTKNIEYIVEKQPQVYEKIQDCREGHQKFEVVLSRNNMPTVKYRYEEGPLKKEIFLHSSYDPSREAESFARENMQKQCEINILVGFGLGYRAEAIHSLLNEESFLVILESDKYLFREALKYKDFGQLLSDPRVNICVGNEKEQIDFLKELLQGGKECNLIVHNASLNILSEEAFPNIKALFADMNLLKSLGTEHHELLAANKRHNYNIIDQNVGTFFDKFKEVPCIIVCAGPSLDDNIDQLVGLETKALIISVGKALKPLLARGISPHFIITIDPSESTYEQIRGLENLNIPFILLSSAAKLNAEKYNGPKLLAVNNVRDLAPGQEKFVVESGGSVSTTALDIAIKFGCDPIIYVGQDLAYTAGKHHCKNPIYDSVEHKVLKNMRQVKGIDGRYVPTTLGMLSFKRWITARVKKEPGRVFINASKAGAYIDGLIHEPLEQVILQYLKQNVSDMTMLQKHIN